MKLKHNGGNKTDREKLAKSLVLAYANSKPYPAIEINLPLRVIQEESKKLSFNLSGEKLKEIHKIAEKQFLENQNKI